MPQPHGLAHRIKLFINNITVIEILESDLYCSMNGFSVSLVPSSGPTYGLQPPPALPPNPKRGHPMASIVAVFLFLLCLVLSNCQ